MIWWTKSWNPVIGCTKCSPACDNCYAEALHTQRHKALLAGAPMPLCYAEPFGKVRFLSERQAQPLHWKKPQRIFVCNMGDLFHEGVPFWAIDRVYAAMSLCRQHTFMLLTKRPERMLEYMSREDFRKRIYDAGACNFPFPLPNVWLGTTIWDQASADRAVPILLSTPAAKRFVSVEPMLGPVNLTTIVADGSCCIDSLRGDAWDDQDGNLSVGIDIPPALDWVICGGETGKQARPMHPDWPRSLRDQCQGAGVPFFFKQWGEWEPRDHGRKLLDHVPQTRLTDTGQNGGVLGASGKNDCWMQRSGTRKAGRVLDGQTWEEVPV